MELTQSGNNVLLPQIIESEAGYLVGGEFGGDAVEVSRSESGLICNCFIAQVSEGECEHVRAVREFIASIPMSQDRPMLSQADADYYLSKLGKLDGALAANVQSGSEQIDRIKLWLEMEDSKIQRKKDYYILALDNWMHLTGESTKQLVNGILKVRAQQPEIIIDDETTVLRDSRFKRTIPEKQVIDKTALRKHVVGTGEEIEGIKVMIKPHKFSYKITHHEKEEPNNGNS
ncbi:MAG: host-nuclease inhibitor Gam family protein [Candidatus Marinimicrobia bacterium]|nr:host-nuclease inhibitor Gam family protein [Candidatus Neomarinimicrobiota bacterium]